MDGGGKGGGGVSSEFRATHGGGVWGGVEGAGGGYGDAERYIRLVSECDLQPGYPLTDCVQSGSNTARGRGGSLFVSVASFCNTRPGIVAATHRGIGLRLGLAGGVCVKAR